jgi:cyclophilin family peptidyl-prolyl cis-trans isomerase
VLIGFVLVAMVVAIVTVVSVDDDSSTEVLTVTTTEPAAPGSPGATTPTAPVSPPDYALQAGVVYTATITTSLGDIELRLDTEQAPVAAGHFVKLAESGFYDGSTFHRVARQFVIQGGAPNPDGSGTSGSSVVGEVPSDNYPLGSLAAAKTAIEPPGTFDSQFFIVTGPNGGALPNDYARFGTVTRGLEIAQQIEALAPATGDGPPSTTVTIDRIAISQT